MKNLVSNYIKDNIKIKEGNKTKIIVGVSGGADSVVLLDILSNLGFNLIVAHCNFQLREEESERDASFVKNITEKYEDVIFLQKNFDTETYAQDNHVSIEMAARELRYEWFEELRINYSADYIAVGHHRDDSIETLILNLIRGTGIRGLLGIRNKMNYIIRPLLCLSRNDIENYIETEHLKFITDSTNLENIYSRNIIRLEVLPIFEKINKSYRKSIFQSMENLKEVEKIYQYYVQNQISVVLQNNKIDILKLKESISPVSILHEILHPLGFKKSIIIDIIDSLNGEAGKLFYSDSHVILKDRKFLLIQNRNEFYQSTRKESELELIIINENDRSIYYPNKIDIDILSIENISTLKTPHNIIYADLEKIQFPLTLRKWKKGDSFYPLGMKGKKQKISDYFINNKFSVFEKEKAWLLISNKEIVWIINNRLDDRFKITENTKKVLRIQWDE